MEHKVKQVTVFGSSHLLRRKNLKKKKILIIHMTGHSKNYFQIKCFLHLF